VAGACGASVQECKVLPSERIQQEHCSKRWQTREAACLLVALERAAYMALTPLTCRQLCVCTTSTITLVTLANSLKRGALPAQEADIGRTAAPIPHVWNTMLPSRVPYIGSRVLSTDGMFFPVAQGRVRLKLERVLLRGASSADALPKRQQPYVERLMAARNDGPSYLNAGTLNRSFTPLSRSVVMW
jgi:hypothetical protein